MPRPPDPPAWRTRVAAIWCSDQSFRIALGLASALLLSLAILSR